MVRVRKRIGIRTKTRRITQKRIRRRIRTRTRRTRIRVTEKIRIIIIKTIKIRTMIRRTTATIIVIVISKNNNNNNLKNNNILIKTNQTKFAKDIAMEVFANEDIQIKIEQRFCTRWCNKTFCEKCYC